MDEKNRLMGIVFGLREAAFLIDDRVPKRWKGNALKAVKDAARIIEDMADKEKGEENG